VQCGYQGLEELRCFLGRFVNVAEGRSRAHGFEKAPPALPEPIAFHEKTYIKGFASDEVLGCDRRKLVGVAPLGQEVKAHQNIEQSLHTPLAGSRIMRDLRDRSLPLSDVREHSELYRYRQRAS